MGENFGKDEISSLDVSSDTTSSHAIGKDSPGVATSYYHTYGKVSIISRIIQPSAKALSAQGLMAKPSVSVPPKTRLILDIKNAATLRTLTSHEQLPTINKQAVSRKRHPQMASWRQKSLWENAPSKPEDCGESGAMVIVRA